jgi:hypothetical protein
MSTFVFSPKHKGAEYRSLVVGMIDSDGGRVMWTAVKQNKQPTHTAARLRSWSGPVETDFQGLCQVLQGSKKKEALRGALSSDRFFFLVMRACRLRFSYDNMPAHVASVQGPRLSPEQQP